MAFGIVAREVNRLRSYATSGLENTTSFGEPDACVQERCEGIGLIRQSICFGFGIAVNVQPHRFGLPGWLDDYRQSGPVVKDDAVHCRGCRAVEDRASVYNIRTSLAVYSCR